MGLRRTLPDLVVHYVEQRHYDLREAYNGLRWMVYTGAIWRILPHDLLPRYIIYQHLMLHQWMAFFSP